MSDSVVHAGVGQQAFAWLTKEMRLFYENIMRLSAPGLCHTSTWNPGAPLSQLLAYFHSY